MVNQKITNNKESKRDVFGRNISYLKCYSSKLENLADVDIYSSDFESGYSPLHITLKEGHFKRSFKLFKHWKEEKEFLSHKFGGHVMNQVDREGLTPFELYMCEYRRLTKRYPKYVSYRLPGSEVSRNRALISWYDDKKEIPMHTRMNFPNLPKTAEEREYLELEGGSHVLSFGSNVNYQLGTGTKDNRLNLYQLNVHQLVRKGVLLSDIRFKNVIMTRYHSLLVTSNDQIYVAGSSGRGRLGNNNIDTPQIQYVKVSGLPNQKIKDVSSSDHHTLVLYSDNEIYSWGWNYCNQLGYLTTNKSEDKSPYKVCSAVPKRITFLPGEKIISISCSRIHSAVVTKNGTIMLWGLNVGQMGTSKPLHLKPDSQYMSIKGYIVLKPVIINLSGEFIKQILCTEFATFVRTQNNTLYVYSNYSVRTFRLSLPRASTYLEHDNFTYFSPREIPSNIVDMKCKNPFGNNLTLRYACGRIGMIKHKEESLSMWSRIKNTPNITLCWTPNFEFRRSIDFDIGLTGNLIIATVGGEIYKTNSTDGNFEKVFSTKLASGRISKVSCDSQFGSFILLKNDYDTIPLLYHKNPVLYDFARFCDLIPIPTLKNDSISNIYNPLGRETFRFQDYVSHKSILPSNADLDDESSKIDYENFSNAQIPLESLDNLGNGFRNLLNYDIIFQESTTGKIICKCHKLLFAARCATVCNTLKNENVYILNEDQVVLKLKNNENENVWNIEVSGYTGTSVIKEAIRYLYTDIRPENQKISRLLLEMIDHVIHYGSLQVTLKNLYLTTVESTQKCLGASPDTKILFDDGYLMAHSMVLSARVPYFRTLFQNEWFVESDEGYKVVNLQNICHIKKKTFGPIVRYIYDVPYNRLFDEIDASNMIDNLQILIDLLQLSDFMNIYSLTTYLETEVEKYIDGETVIMILLNAIEFGCDMLTLKCMWFICKNIMILFSKDNINLIDEYFTDAIWARLESVFFDLTSSSKNITTYLSWYHNNDYDWLSLFKGNVIKFNEKFMDPTNTFVPIFDWKDFKKSNTDGSTNRRRSSASQAPKLKTPDSSRRSSIREQNSIRLENTGTSSVWTQNLNSSNAIDDSEQFVEVTKKVKRKNSRQPNEKPELLNVINESSLTKVVLHKSIEENVPVLDSLLTVDSSKFSINDGSLTILQKLSGTFKKNSQKERRKQKVIEDEPSSLSGKQAVWGKASSTVSSISDPASINSVKSKSSSLPSLYDPSSSKYIGEGSKPKNETQIPVPQSDSIHMPYVRASQQVPMNLIDVHLDKDQLKKRKSKKQMKEDMEAAQFERWFAEESARVQKEMNVKDISIKGNKNPLLNKKKKNQINNQRNKPKGSTSKKFSENTKQDVHNEKKHKKNSININMKA